MLLLWIPLRQRPGLGTVANVLLVDTALDVSSLVLPHPDSLAARLAMCVGGILVVALGSGFYLRCGRLVQQLGTGVHAIDVAGATRLGVAVANMPGANLASVAEGTVLLMLAAQRRLPELDESR